MSTQADSLVTIKLSETAAKEIKSIITEQELPAEKTRLRVGVKGGGCSGFSYVLDLVEEEPGEADEEFESNGVRILVDSRSALYLAGVEVDFKDEVMGRGFVFKNPNATSSCGCGHSFSA
jgi:iron-sulfur cluster assembly protein